MLLEDGGAGEEGAEVCVYALGEDREGTPQEVLKDVEWHLLCVK